MTIPTMKIAAVTLVAVGLVSCGRGADAPVSDELSDPRARAMASDAMRAVDLLEETASELAAQIADLEAERDRTSGRLLKISDRLWSSIDKLRDSVADASGAGASASSQASSALAEASSAARALAVLENRFDYHLNSHD